VARLFLLFTVVPLLELYLLLLIGRHIGVGPTIAIVLLTGLLGATLAKAEGLRVLNQWRSSLSRGRIPEEGVLSGVLVLVGGVVLVTPGVLTDALGLMLLFPPTRRFIASLVKSYLLRHTVVGVFRGPVPGPPFPRQGGGSARGPEGEREGRPWPGSGSGDSGAGGGGGGEPRWSKDPSEISDAEVVDEPTPGPPLPPDR
jgi:UPF0716 protein FxsA